MAVSFKAPNRILAARATSLGNFRIGSSSIPGVKGAECNEGSGVERRKSVGDNQWIGFSETDLKNLSGKKT
jgi:hypothetical protein